MTDRHQLVAYLATLLAIVVLVGIAAVCAATGRSLEAVGVGGAVTGLIGVIRMPTGRSVTTDPQPVTVTNPDSDPVPVAAKE